MGCYLQNLPPKSCPNLTNSGNRISASPDSLPRGTFDVFYPKIKSAVTNTCPWPGHGSMIHDVASFSLFISRKKNNSRTVHIIRIPNISVRRVAWLSMMTSIQSFPVYKYQLSVWDLPQLPSGIQYCDHHAFWTGVSLATAILSHGHWYIVVVIIYYMVNIWLIYG